MAYYDENGPRGKPKRSWWPCIKCGSPDIHVSDSRPTHDEHVKIWRRQCRECGYRWTTKEVNADFYAQLLEDSRTLRDLRQTLKKL